MPIINGQHFYLLVFNFMNGTIDLIDNRLIDESLVQAKYGNIPEKMVRYITMFIKFNSSEDGTIE